MERGFIRAEILSFSDFMDCGSEHAAREKGFLRSEGKDYLIRDGDVVHFRFHV
jgi:ribosome-binding ATPase YchF (GTP1/OBG family)